MARITEEQRIQFWERFGVEPEKKQGYFRYDVRNVYPPIDLNNLFQACAGGMRNTLL